MKIHYLLGLFVVLLLLSACAPASVVVSDGRVLDNIISVSGNAEMKIKPDQAEISMSIVTKAESAKIAQDRNAEATQKVYQALKKYVNKEEISTENYNLYRESKWDEKTQEYLEGDYVLTHSLKIVVKKLDNVGSILDEVVAGGANRLDGLQYTLSDQKELETKQSALSLAAKNAKEKAEILAKSLDVSVGKVKNIQETNYIVTPYYENRVYAMDAMGAAPKAMPEPSPKDVTVTTNVQVEFKIE
ncbi:SIMPL domain-containing protein [Candidatus Woesearchaeota archaeon]|nr:SIMPL domain-containing protein [Candidatus Woesearchaeota archaeon]